MNNNFLTPLEVAEILKLKKNTVYEMIKRGDLRASKLGKQLRISREDLEEFLNGQSNHPQSTAPASTAVTKTPAERSQNTDTKNSIIICGKDTVLDMICEKLNYANNEVTYLRSSKGSYNALFALYNKEVHVATAHLWDSATDTYNITYIPTLLPGMSVKLFHVVSRVQGFYVKKGNPKNITSFKDFSRDDIIFANREKGCGTRILLDENLKQLKISKKNINGYFTEKTSHLDCATAVALGSADFAIGSERAAMNFADIDFIPLKKESLDMIIPSQYVNKPAYQSILSLLSNKTFQTEINALGGYDITNMGQEIFLD